MSPIIEKWNHLSRTAEAVIVPPDGCIDLIVVRGLSESPSWFVSDLQSATQTARLESGTEMEGFRLRPGVTVNLDKLNKAMRSRHGFAKIDEFLEDNCVHNSNVEAAIQRLAQISCTSRKVASDLGISMRTLQRLFASHRLPPPEFWRSLARARLAVKNMRNTTLLAEHAFSSGFSDQSHMTRECMRWFGETPLQIKKNLALQSLIRQPGLATS
jgi:AraC-like DNA-binding protein